MSARPRRAAKRRPAAKRAAADARARKRRAASKRGARTRAAKRGVAKRRAAPKRAAATRAEKRRPTPKRAAKRRTAPKRAAGTGATPKRATRRRPTPKPAAPKRTTARRKPGLPTGSKRATKPRAAARRPALAVVRRRVPPPPPFSGATAGASAKELALFELVRARVALAAAIQGMDARSAETPTAPGKWSPREMVLHLAFWDREVLPHVEPAWRENRRFPMTFEQILARNPEGLDELRHHDWDSARRLLQASRERLVETLQSIPDEPAGMWTPEHALGALLGHLARHDRHHAEAIKAARAAGGARPGDPAP